MIPTDKDIVWGKPKKLGDLLGEYTDKGYKYSKISVYRLGNDLQIRFRGYKVSARFMTIKYFTRFTAREVLYEYYPSLGRHFRDAILKTWNDLDLSLGYVMPICRDLEV